jgi:hypothetical protein
MTEDQYAAWMVKDTAVSVLQAVGIYAAALGAYWIFIG